MSNAVATLQPTRMPIARAIADEFSLSPTNWRVLVDQIFPAAQTVEAVIMALDYCRTRKLDIYKKPVHIVPMWSSAKKRMVETVWPGIAEIRTTAARTGEYAGIDEVQFGPMVDREFKGVMEKWVEGEQGGGKQKKQVEVKKTVSFPEWASVIVYRIVGGQRCAFHTKVFWEETYASVGKTDVPNDMWEKRPRGQLDKCVEAAALRKAFPEEVGSMYAAEEMEGRVLDDVTPETKQPPKPTDPKPEARKEPPKPAADQAAKPDGSAKQQASTSDRETADFTNDNIVDAEVTEIVDRETGEVSSEEEQSVAEGGRELSSPNELLQAMDDEMKDAKDEATVEEMWSTYDLMAKFEKLPDSDINQAIARKIRAKHLRRVLEE